MSTRDTKGLPLTCRKRLCSDPLARKMCKTAPLKRVLS